MDFRRQPGSSREEQLRDQIVEDEDEDEDEDEAETDSADASAFDLVVRAKARTEKATVAASGPQFARVRYGEEVDREHPSIKYTVPNREPLWAVVTLDPGKLEIRIEGARTEFVGPAPWELGRTYEEWDGDTIRPAISGRSLPLG